MSSAAFAAADRLAGSRPSIWVEFTALAKEAGAVNVGQGFPDYGSCPQYVLDALAKATTTTPLLNQYTRGFGHAPLVQNLAKLYSGLLGRPVDPMGEVLVTAGAYQALFYTIFAYINPGDEVVIIEPAFDCFAPMTELAGGRPVFATLRLVSVCLFQAILLEPYYDCYEPQVRMAGGVPIGVPLRLVSPTRTTPDRSSAFEDPGAGPEPTSADLKLDFAELESKFSDKTKILVINNPHNPTGKLFTAEELTKLAALAVKYNVIVIADEVYEWLVYAPGKMIRFASLPGMWDRTVTVGSAGKTFSVTGWKLGWAVAPAPIMKQLQFVHQNCVYTCPTTVQEAVAQGFEKEISLLGSGSSYFESISAELEPKRNAMVAACREAGLRPIVPESGYFMLADISSVSKYT